MKTLGQLLGSPARTEVLRALRYQPGPIGLRPLARLADIYPHSVELALKSLIRDGLVHKVNAGARPLYELNRKRRQTAVIEAVFDAAASAAAGLTEESRHERASWLCSFIADATRLTDRLRKAGGGTRKHAQMEGQGHDT